MKRVTVKDIAKRSGYSIATVSKTLNGTDRVGAETIEKIKKIAAEMGYRSSFSAQSLARRARKVALVLFEHPPEVRRLFELGFEESFDIYGEFGIEPVYWLFEDMGDVDWAAVSAGSDAAIVTPGAGLEGCAQALDALGRRIPLVFLQSKPPVGHLMRLCEVTVNARVAGMLAAQFLGICAPGSQTAILTGCPGGWIHGENVRGFLEAAPAYGLENCSVAACYDDLDRAYQATRKLLLDHPELRGIFVTSYVSPAVCRCAGDLDRPVHIIGVDLFRDSAACLRAGMLDAVLFQNQQRQAQMAVEAAVSSFRGLAQEACVMVKPELVLSANLSCYEWI